MKINVERQTDSVKHVTEAAIAAESFLMQMLVHVNDTVLLQHVEAESTPGRWNSVNIHSPS